MNKTTQPRRPCPCGRQLKWHRQSGSWYCPELDEIAPAYVGVLEPPKGHLSEHIGDHISCLPGELIDDSQEPTARELAVRGINVIKRARVERDRTERPKRDSDGKLIIYDDRGVPVSKHSPQYQQREVWQCEGCGYRTPSRAAMMNHVTSTGHNRAETLNGEIIDVTPRGTPRVGVSTW